MNNNRRKKTLKLLKAAIICGAFFLILGASIDMLITETRAHAAYLSATATAVTPASPILAADGTPTSPPTPTPTPTPIISLPTIIPPSPTPTKPQPTATPKPTPTQAPIRQPTVPMFQPTPTIAAGGIIPPGFLPTTTDTPPTKPKPTPGKTPTTTATPTATASANSTATTPTKADPTQTTAGGMNPLVMPIAIGSGIAVLASTFLGIFFLKRPKSNRPAPFSTTFNQTLAQTAKPAPWLNQSNANAAFVMPGGDHLVSANEQIQAQAATSAISMSANQQKTNTPPPPSVFTGPQKAIAMPSSTQKTAAVTHSSTFTGPQRAIAMPSITQKRKSVSAKPAPSFSAGIVEALPYPISSNPRPVTAPLAQPGAAFTQKNPVSTSDMNPFPLDNLDFSNMLPQTNRRHDSLWDAPTTTGKNQQPFSPLSAPSIQDDPILETIMRQAQMGIYAIADKSPSDPSDEINDSFLA